MTALLIDTLSFATQLRTTGFTSQQSDGLARALYDSVLDKIATKQDVGGLKQDVGILKQDVDVLKSDVGILKQDVQVLKSDVGILKQDVDVLKKDVVEIKQDLKDFRQEFEVFGVTTKKEFAAIDDRFTIKLAEMKTEMIKWFVGGLFGTSALILGVLKLTP